MSKLSKKKIGITGSIGSGKSTALKLLSESYPTISADEIVSNLYQKPEVINYVNKNILNIESVYIDIKCLAKVIFSDLKLKKKLEEYIFPLVKKEIIIWQNQQTTLSLVEVPLLFEAKFENLFDKIILIDTSLDNILSRLKKRNISEEEALKRLKTQMSINKKRTLADYIVKNDLKILDLKENLENTIKIIKEN